MARRDHGYCEDRRMMVRERLIQQAVAWMQVGSLMLIPRRIKIPFPRRAAWGTKFRPPFFFGGGCGLNTSPPLALEAMFTQGLP